MGSLPRPAVAYRAPSKENNIRVLLPILLFSLPVFALLFHCASRNHWADIIHGLVSTPTFDPIDSVDTLSSTAFLYVASYGGSVTTLKLTHGGGAQSLKPVATTEGCAGSPSWLTLDSSNDVLYCTDEGLSSPDREGSISSFRVIKDGSLVRLSRTRTVSGPVSAAVYGKGGSGLVVAHYGGSALSAWDVENPAEVKSLQTRLFRLNQPGPDPSRQEAPHPHEVVVDPTGKFVLVPDLGADLIRIYAIHDTDLGLEEREPLVVAWGSGPRHVAFVTKAKKTFMYLVTELANTVVGYEVTYGDDSISFEEIWSSGIHGKGTDVPLGAAASEIIISPDSNFLVLSSRNESTFNIPNLDPNNSTQVTSDPLITFSINPKTGHLGLLEEVPCGGKFPRQFSMNKDGSLVAVALQTDSRVVVMERNVDTGNIGEIVAYADIEGDATAVIFQD